MNVVLWIVQGLLAALYLAAGSVKLAQSPEKLLETGRMNWVRDYSAGTVKFIGAVEVLGAIGLILPWATGIAEIFTPVAAVGLAVIQLLAIPVHLKHKEGNAVPINVVLAALAVFVAVGRFAG